MDRWRPGLGCGIVCRVTAGENSPGGWDFFISYTQADRAWAEWIAWVLEEDGHRVLVQAWDFVPGTNWIQGMQAGTRDAARTIAVLSARVPGVGVRRRRMAGGLGQDPAGDRPQAADRPGRGVRPAGAAGRGGRHGSVRAGRGRRRRPGCAAWCRRRSRAGPSRRCARVSRARAGRCRGRPRFPGALPQVWKVPARNPNFTGRGPDLDTLARALAAGSAVTVHSVHGLGGVGKTQLATEYAYAHAGDYDLVWWIAAEEPAAIPDQFAALAARLGLDPPADPEVLRAQVHDVLRSVPGWLLIFDNADRAEDIGPWLPGGPLPPGVPGHVIVTTRRGGFAAMGPVLDLDVIDLPDAVRLLRARVPDLGQETGEQIAGELGRLPLALEQAAA